MRFRAGIHNTVTFTKFTASLASLGNVAWVRLSSDDVRFTIIPERGSQVWSQLAIDSIFDPYTIQSASANNAINLEVPLAPLLRALKSASLPNATSANIRLTKKDDIPWLCMTIVTNATASTSSAHAPDADDLDDVPDLPPTSTRATHHAPAPFVDRKERETVITQDIPVRVLTPEHVAGLHEPLCRDPDVHISLPPLAQLKAVSDKFTRLAQGPSASGAGAGSGFGNASNAARGKAVRLELSATMHGDLRLAFRNDSLRIGSMWRGLQNPELDPGQVGGEEALRRHPSTRMKETRVVVDDDEGEDDGERSAEAELQRGWARVRIDARDWGRVLSCGRVGGRVVACFCHDHALILYVYLSAGESEVGSGDESVLTYYISSYSS